MGCPIIPSPEYPEYINKILKIIESKDRKDLQSCFCQLTSPQENEEDGWVGTTDAICRITDADNKYGLFPFCAIFEEGPGPDKDFTNNEEKIGLVGKGTEWPSKMTLKQAMYLYWKMKTIKIDTESKFKSYRSDACMENPEEPLYECGDMRQDVTNLEEFDRSNKKEKYEWVCKQTQTLTGKFKWEQRLCDCVLNPETGKCENCKQYEQCKYEDDVFIDFFFGPTRMKMTKENNQYWFYPYIVYESIYKFRPYTGARTVTNDTNAATLKPNFFKDLIKFPDGTTAQIHIFDGCEDESKLVFNIIEEKY